MAKSQQVQSNRDYTKTLTIEVGQSASEAINISGSNLVGLIIPANLTATFLNFLVNTVVSGNYKILKTNVAKTASSPPVEFNVGLNVSVDSAVAFKPEDLGGWQFIKIKTVDNADVADNQLTTPAIITLVLRPIS